MIDYSIFKSFGLSDKEAMIYLYILANTSTGASEIEKGTGVGRTYIYDIAEKLIDKGFLRQSQKEKKKVFIAVSPKELLSNQKKLLSDFENNLKALEELEKKDLQKPEIVYYSGKKELASMMENFISRSIDKEAVAFSDDSFYTVEQGEHQEKEINKRLKQGVFFRALAPMSIAVIKSKKRDKEENRETRMLPRDGFDLKVMLGAHGSKTVVVNYKKDFAFVVEDKDLADTVKELFNFIWKSGKILE